MKEEIKRILNEIKEHYDDIGICFYPDEILNPNDPKILYDYITKLENKLKKVRKVLLTGFDTQETIFKALRVLNEEE